MIAEHLGVPLSVIDSMSTEEFFGWIAFLNWKAKQDKAAIGSHKAARRRGL
jgi:hypothetical protein